MRSAVSTIGPSVTWPGCHTQRMTLSRAGWSTAGLAFVVVAGSACVAPDVEVVGALGITVDQQRRPVVVVEACEGAATEVDLFLDRQGLAEDEENEQVAAWTSDPPVPGMSELVLHAPAGSWVGDPVGALGDRGYVASAAGEGDREVLSQVAFRGGDLAGLEPGTVYTNDPDPDERALIGRSAQDFAADVCSRG